VTENNRLKRKKVIPRVVNAVDLFCGAGGTSSGLIQAVNSLGYDIKLTAINHWDVAIATHTKNHENVAHYCQSIETVNPTDIVKGGRLQLLVASPECTHHSNARGGKPRNDQKRADAWLLMRWIEKLYVENILIENVKEFESWGPLTAKGLPDKRYKGEYFKAFLAQLRINYNVEYRVLNCADYGDPTTRERLFILARRPKHKPIVWPDRTHASRKTLARMAAQPDLFLNEKLDPWVAAREIIDWTLEGKSIFGRKKPLSPNTMRRIFAGLEKYGLRKFLVNLKNQERRDRSVEEPTFTQAAGGNHQAVCEPFLIKNFGDASEAGYRSKSVDDPLGTVCAQRNHHGLVEIEPFIVPQFSSPDARDIDEPVPTLTTTSRGVGVVEAEAFMLGQQSGATAREVDEPVPTVASKGAIGLVEVDPFIVSAAHGGNTNPPRDIEEPLGAVLGSNKYGVVEAFTLSVGRAQTNRSAPRPVDEPVATITGSPRLGIVEGELTPFTISAGGPELPAQSVDEPMRTVLTRDHQAIVEAFLVKFHGGQHSDKRTYPVDEPIGTLDTSNRYAVVEAEPFIFDMSHTQNPDGIMCKDLEFPLPTVAGKGMFGLVEAEPYLVNMKGRSDARSLDEPTFTQTRKHHQYIAEPYIVKFYGNEKAGESVHEPLDTVTAKDRFGLCIPSIGAVLDIRFRMLQPHELAAAMSFPAGYEFTGNREAKVKQIGNAVPLKTARALCTALLGK
jgi:DNA (cytosine-5)-methyltransferase 1